MNLPETWRDRLAAESERTSRERAARHRRRADIYRDAIRELGTQQALADELGVTKQAVHRHLRAETDERDLLTLLLPLSAGADIVGVGEWETFSEQEQPGSARRALDEWRAVDATLTHLHRQTLALVEAVDDVLSNQAEADVARVLRERLAPWDVPAPVGVAGAETLRAVLDGLARRLDHQRRFTRSVTVVWEERAHGPLEAGPYDS